MITPLGLALGVSVAASGAYAYHVTGSRGLAVVFAGGAVVAYLFPIAYLASCAGITLASFAVVAR